MSTLLNQFQDSLCSAWPRIHTMTFDEADAFFRPMRNAAILAGDFEFLRDLDLLADLYSSLYAISVLSQFGLVWRNR